MPRRLRLAALTFSAAAFVFAALAAPARADAVFDWNAKAEAIVTERQSSPLLRAQSLAILHTAIFTAMNAVEPPNNAEKQNVHADQDACVEAAAATAAHAVLVALYPELTADLTTALASSLARIANGVPKARGHLAGKKAAAAVLEAWMSKKPSIAAAHPSMKD